MGMTLWPCHIKDRLSHLQCWSLLLSVVDSNGDKETMIKRERERERENEDHLQFYGLLAPDQSNVRADHSLVGRRKILSKHAFAAWHESFVVWGGRRGMGRKNKPGLVEKYKEFWEEIPARILTDYLRWVFLQPNFSPYAIVHSFALKSVLMIMR